MSGDFDDPNDGLPLREPQGLEDLTPRGFCWLACMVFLTSFAISFDALWMIFR